MKTVVLSALAIITGLGSLFMAFQTGRVYEQSKPERHPYPYAVYPTVSKGDCLTVDSVVNGVPYMSQIPE